MVITNYQYLCLFLFLTEPYFFYGLAFRCCGAGTGNAEFFFCGSRVVLVIFCPGVEKVDLILTELLVYYCFSFANVKVLRYKFEFKSIGPGP